MDSNGLFKRNFPHEQFSNISSNCAITTGFVPTGFPHFSNSGPNNPLYNSPLLLRRATSSPFHRKEINTNLRRGRGMSYHGGGFPHRRSSYYLNRSNQPPPPSWNAYRGSLQQDWINCTLAVGTPTTQQLLETPQPYNQLKDQQESDDREISSGEFSIEDQNIGLIHQRPSDKTLVGDTIPFQGYDGNHTFHDWGPTDGTSNYGRLQHQRSSGSREFLPALQVTIQKTRLCVHLTRGRQCHKQNCMFAHSTNELRQRPNLFRTKLCRVFNETGLCENGDECRFAHGLQELRHTKEFYKTALCSLWKSSGTCRVGHNCRFAHGPEELRPPPNAYGMRSWETSHDNDLGQIVQRRIHPDCEVGQVEGEGSWDENAVEDNFAMKVVGSCDGLGQSYDDGNCMVNCKLNHIAITNSTTIDDCLNSNDQNQPIERTSLPQEAISGRMYPSPLPTDTTLCPDPGTLVPLPQLGNQRSGIHVSNPPTEKRCLRATVEQPQTQPSSLLRCHLPSPSSLMKITEDSDTNDGVVMPEQRRLHKMEDKPEEKKELLQGKPHFNFWPGSSIERTTNCPSPTPSTQSSPATVFRKSNGLVCVDLTATTNDVEEDSRKSSDFLTQISHFKPAIASTHESVYSVQYED